MALVTLNTINTEKGENSDFFTEVIFYPLITDSGPTGYTLVSSLDELRLKFMPSSITENWLYAQSLLSCGYKLLVAKLIDVETDLTLRIFESYTQENIVASRTEERESAPDPVTGMIKKENVVIPLETETITVPISYSHPKRGVEYKKVSLPWKYGNRDSIILPESFSYSIKIPFPETFQLANYIFLTLKKDPLLTKSGQVHRFIGFGSQDDFRNIISSEVATDIKYINIHEKSREAIINEVIEILVGWGIYKEYEEGEYIVFSSFNPVQYGTTCKYSKLDEGNLIDDFKYIKNNKAGSYDIICSAADDHKLVDFYSKDSLAVDGISVEAIKNFDGNYSLYITAKIPNEISNEDSANVKTEFFRVSMNRNSPIFIENVLRSSEIVDCVWYKEGDISGRFTMRCREDPKESTGYDMLEVLKDLPKLEEKTFDIIVDAGLPVIFQRYLYDVYKDYMCVKLFQLRDHVDEKDADGNLVNKRLVIPDNRSNGVLYCANGFSINGVNYPLWCGILSLLKNKGLFSGDISPGFLVSPAYEDDDGNLKPCIIDDSQYICKLLYDEYRFIIPSTPIKFGGSTYSLDLIWLLTMIRNKVIPVIDPNLVREDFIREFNADVRTLMNGKRTRIRSVLITGYKRLDRTLMLEIEVTHEDLFVDSVSMNITIKIY